MKVFGENKKQKEIENEKGNEKRQENGGRLEELILY